jgi:Aspartyl protease
LQWRACDLRRTSWFLLLTWTAASVWAQAIPEARDAVPFEVNQDFGAILIHARINGQLATLLVDTGSSHTLLSAELLQVRATAVEQVASPLKGSGFTGRAVWAKANITLGADAWPDRKVLVIDDLREISKSMKQQVDGILGQDILKEFHFILIDFKRQRLVLGH